VRIDFDWDPAKAASNISTHGVTFEQSMAVFRDPLAQSIRMTPAVKNAALQWARQTLAICWWSCTLG
jgi:uncharacterized protein